MPETAFIITVDTEGDNLWSRPREITTRNSAFLPRFQALAERHGFRPVYLTNHEMANCPVYDEFIRDVLARDAGELGMHLHAWNQPPLVPLTADDFRHQPYLVEYPKGVMREKVRRITGLLEDRFGHKMISHRAGRWAFDSRYAQCLLDEGYLVDCSVTPGIDWRGARGDPAGRGGSDYRHFPSQAYFLDPADIARPAGGRLLEVPMTVNCGRLYRAAPWLYRIPVLRRFARAFSPAPAWLSPADTALPDMLRAAAHARAGLASHIEFMLHSSELMPGGSPGLRTADDIERLYDWMEALFSQLAGWCRGMTLGEFHKHAGAKT